MASQGVSSPAQGQTVIIALENSGSSASEQDSALYTPPHSVSSMSSADKSAPPAPGPGTSTSTIITATHSTSAIPAYIAAANISVREYIYFLPYPLPPGTPVPYSTGLPQNNPLNLPTHQFEPTSTLVLTSPHCTFVDIRLFKPLKESDAPLPNKGERERLEWAFAGKSTSRPPSAGGITKLNSSSGKSNEELGTVTHSTWTHWIDSRHSVGSANIPVDEGDMYPISPDLTLEHGHAYQPLMHAVKTHEEMWRDVEIKSTTHSGTKICVVLRVHDDMAKVRGMLVRLGQFAQGLVMAGAYSTVERWEWVDGGSDGGGGGGEGGESGGGIKGNIESGWKRLARIGDLFLPCAVTFRPEILAVGSVIKYHDYEWFVEECWEWS